MQIDYWLIAYIVLFLAGMGILGVGGGIGVWRFFKWKRYNGFNVTIFAEDSFGQKVIRHDRGGIFVEGKTNNKKLFIEKENVGLDYDKLKYIIDSKGKKNIFLVCNKDKDYHFIYPEFVKPTNLQFTMGEEDLNWGINAYERAKNAYDFKNMIMQYLPFAGLVFLGMIFIVFVVVVLKKFDVFVTLADKLHEIALVLKEASTNTQIIK